MPGTPEQTVTLPVSVVEDMGTCILVLKEVLDNHLVELSKDEHKRISYATKLMTGANSRIQELMKKLIDGNSI